jgi:hypothetical protein
MKEFVTRKARTHLQVQRYMKAHLCGCKRSTKGKEQHKTIRWDTIQSTKEYTPRAKETILRITYVMWFHVTDLSGCKVTIKFDCFQV